MVFFKKKARKIKGFDYFYPAMKKIKLRDGTVILCLRKPEAKMLDHHVEGYHDDHHSKLTRNYSSTFTWMDRIFKSNFKD